MEPRNQQLAFLAARLAAGMPLPDEADSCLSDLIALLRDNKFPLLDLRGAPNWMENSPEFKACLEAQARLCSQLFDEYSLVQREWDKANITGLLIKSDGSFPYLSDNLDVLVRQGQGLQAKAILRRLGYIELTNIEEPQKFLFRKFHAGECVSAIHLHTQVGWGVSFLDEEALWRRSRLPSEGDWLVPSPEDTILITLAHAFYENKKFRLGDLWKVRQCLGQELDWHYMEEQARQRGWLDGLCFSLLVCSLMERSLLGKDIFPKSCLDRWHSVLASYRWAYRYYLKLTVRPAILPLPVSFLFSKLLYYQKILRDPQNKPGERLANTVRTLAWGIKLKSGLRPQPSLLVSFSGPDGSGKTSHAQALVQVLKVCELDVAYSWSRCASSGTYRFFSWLAGKVRRPQLRGSHALGYRQSLRNPLLRVPWTFLVAGDLALFYLLKARLPLLMGRIVICDRYTYDAAAEIEASLPSLDRLSRWAVGLMLALAPRPTVGYLLEVPEAVSVQRKGEDTELGYLRRQRRVYQRLTARYGIRVKSTEREFSATTDEIVKEVLPPYLDNFDTLLNGILLSNPSQLNRRTAI